MVHITEIEHPTGKVIGTGNIVVGILRCEDDRLVLASPELGESDEEFRAFVGRVARPRFRLKRSRRIPGR